MRWISLISSGCSHTFFSSAHETFSNIDDIWGHKSNLSKFKKIEIVSSILSNHNTMRLQVNYKKNNCKKHKHMEIKQYVLNNQQVSEVIKREIKNFLLMTMKTRQLKTYRMQQKQF